MTWVKLDDGFPDHPKVTALPLPARWLHVCALCYCSKYLTDGRLTYAQAVALHAAARPTAAAPGRHRGRSNGVTGAAPTFEQLVACGLWERRGDDFEIHDFLRYNPSREQVLSERAAARARMDVRRKFAGSSPDVQANAALFARSSPSPSRPGRKDKSSALARNSGSPEHDPGLQVEEYTDASGRLRFRSRSDQPPPPELPPVEDDDSPADLPDQTDPTTADNLPQEPW